jgi:VCBS repeat-containing protein
MFPRFTSFAFFGSKTARNSISGRGKQRQQHRRDMGRRLILESLEDRRLLASDLFVDDGFVNPVHPRYTNIPDAVNAAEDGDTVFINNGTYNVTDTIDVDVSITIEGNATGSVIVTGADKNGSLNNGADVLFNVTADGVTIKNLTIDLGDDDSDFDVGIFTPNDASVDNLTVQSVTMRYAAYGAPNGFGEQLIHLGGGLGHQILDNDLETASLNSSIYVGDNTNTDLTIQGNTFDVDSDADGGGTAINSFGPIVNGSITENIFTKTGIAIWIGADELGTGTDTSNVEIRRNTFTDNTSTDWGSVVIAAEKNGVATESIAITNNVFSGSTGPDILVQDFGDTGDLDGDTIQIRENSIGSASGTGLKVVDVTGVIDASANWWGSSVEATVAGAIDGLANVDFTPFLDNGIDGDGGTAGFQGQFATLHVTSLGGQSGVVGRIQEAIDLVDGSTVNVGSGTYIEDLLIDVTKTGLDLAGAGLATTTIKGVTTTAQASFPLAEPNINVLAAGVKIHGFKIESPDVPAGEYSSGIVLDSPNVEIYDNEFESIQSDPPPAGANDSKTNVTIQTWFGSNSGKSSNVDGLHIHGNVFHSDTSAGKGYYGIFVNPQGETVAGTVTIEDNEFRGNIWRAIEVERSNALIDENTIEPSAETLHAWGGSGISVRDFFGATIDGVTISNNVIQGADAAAGQGFTNGILLGYGGETLTGITVDDNMLSGHATGLRVAQNVGDLTLGATITNNAFSSNVQYHLRDESEDLTGAGVYAIFAGAGDNTFDTATVVTDGAEAIQSTTSLNIRPGIQQSIDDASAGQTVEVAAGTYAEDLRIDKSVTIVGSGTVELNSEHTITVSDVTLDNLVFNGDSNEVLLTLDSTGGALDNITIKNSTFNMPTSPQVGIWMGIADGAWAISNVTIEDNEFHGPADKIANPFKIGGDLVQGSFDVAITGVTFQRNQVDSASIPVNVRNADIQDLVLTQNTFTNTDGVLYFWAMVDEADTSTGQLLGFQFTENVVDGTNSYGIGVNVFANNGLDADNFDAADPPLIRDNSFAIPPAGAYGLHAVTVQTTGSPEGAWDGLIIDASSNYWGATTPAEVAAQVSGHVDYTPWLDSGTDSDPETPGWQGISYAVLHVDDDSPQADAVGRIQEAIDQVSGSTVHVAAGTYVEDLVIAVDNLELAGADDEDPSLTVVQGVAMTASTLWPLAAPNVEVIANGVNIHGLTFRSPDAAEDFYSSGMVIGGDNVEIHHNVFQTASAANLDDISQAVQTYTTPNNPVLGADLSGLNIHNNEFTSFGAGVAGYEAIYLNPTDTAEDAIALSDNTLTGALVRGITTERSNVTISGGRIETTLQPMTGALEAGESLQAINIVGAAAVTVDGVSIGAVASGFTQGIRARNGASLAVTGAVVSDAGIGILAMNDGTQVVIEATDLRGNEIGIQVSDGALVDAGGGSLGSTGGNDLSGYVPFTTFAVYNENLAAEPDVFAQDCDFGSSLETVIESVVWDDTDDASLSQVIFDSVAVSATEVWVDDDWQSLALGELVMVDTESLTIGTDAFGYIQQGIDALVTAGTVHVLEGSYAEDLRIDKSVTIAGSGTVELNSEHTITASDVILDNLVFNGGSNEILLTLDSTGGALDNITIKNSTFNMPTSPQVGIWMGIADGAGAISNVTIEDNEFHGPADKIANPFKIGGDLVQGSFDVAIDGVTFQRNQVDSASIPVNVRNADIQDLVLTQNTFTNTDGVLYFWAMVDEADTSMGQLLGFQFTENVVDATNSYGIGVNVFANNGLDADNFDAADPPLIRDNSFAIPPAGAYGLHAVTVQTTGSPEGAWDGLIIDASSNYWGATTPAEVAAQVSGHVDYTPWLDSGTDSDPETPGWQGISYAVLHVDDDSPQAGAVGRIQEAINQVSGSTVHVAAGTYVEDLVIAVDNLELAGADDDDPSLTVIRGIATEPWMDFPLATPNIDIQADGVKIHGFTIKSPEVADGHYSSGMVLSGTDIEIFHNAFFSEGLGDAASVVIQTYRDNVLGTESDISGLQIRDNAFSGTSPGGFDTIFINHTNVGTGAVAIEGNTVSGNAFRAVATERSNTIIRGNTFSTVLGSPSSGIQVMDLDGRAQSDVTVEGNDISGFARGVRIGIVVNDEPQDLTDIVVRQNVITGNGIGIQVRTSADGVTVTENSLGGNTGLSVDNADTGTILDASGNYFGIADPSEVAALVSSDVDYTPWLHGGTNDSPGFTGDFSVLHVDDDSPQAGAVGRIQEAINLVSDSTVHVAAGTYVEDLVITVDNLELAGADDGDPSLTVIRGIATEPWTNFPLATPNIDIQADGVQIHGFTIKSPDVADGFYSSGMVLTGTDIEIFHNAFVSEGSGNAASVVIQTYRDEVLGTESDISGLHIRDNAFSGTSPGGFDTMFINHTNVGTGAVTIEDNTVTGNAFRAVATERSNTIVRGNTFSTVLGSPSSGIQVMDLDGRAQSEVTVEGNDISGFARGVRIGIVVNDEPQDLTDIVVRQNVITGNGIGVQVRTSADGVTVAENSLGGNTGLSVDNTDAGTILDASGNYFGTVDPSAVAALVSADVDYTPWLHGGTENEPGFTGDFSVLNVDDDSPQVGAVGWIQEAINAVAEGGTVNVHPGEYEAPKPLGAPLTSGIVVHKSVVLQSVDGPSVTSIGSNATAAVTITGDDVTLEGFTIDQSYTNTPGVLVDHADGTIIRGNVIAGNFRDQILGVGMTNGQIVDNTIGRTLDSNNGEAIDLDGGSHHVLISGNTIDMEGTGANGIRIMNAGHDITITENTIQNVGGYSGIQVFGVGGNLTYNIDITKNEIGNIGGNGIETGFDIQGIRISENEIHHTAAGMAGVNVFVLTSGNLPVIHGNSFHDNAGFGVKNDGGNTTLDASGNYFGTADPSEVAALVSGDVDYTPWLHGGTNNSPGFAGDFSVLSVDDDSPQVGAVGRIQEAINLVSGSTVHVAAGTYVEDLVITVDNLELAGADDGDPSLTIIRGIATEPWASFPLATPNIDIQADEVQIHGFTIKSPDVADGHYSSGMVLSGTDIEIFHNAFFSEGSGDAASVVLQTYRDNVLGTESDISGLQIRDNTFSGTSPGGFDTIFINHTNVGTGAVTIQDNTVSGNAFRAVFTERSNTIIRGNTFSSALAASSGVQVMDLNGRAQSNVTVEGNDISGFARGVRIGIVVNDEPQDLTDIVVRQNVITGNGIGIQVRTSADGVTVAENSLGGNTGLSVDNTDAGTILDASGNYFGTVDPSAVAALVSADVDYTPWLHGGMENEPGFTGDFSVLSVDDDSPQTGTLGRIEEALGLVSGSTVYIHDGTYEEDVATGAVNLEISGDTPGVVEIDALDLSSNASLGIDIQLDSEPGILPGDDHDQVVVNGPVSLDGADLSVTITGTSPSIGDQFVIIDNGSEDPVAGAGFKDLPEGANLVVGSTSFRISYAGGDGNDVVLTVVDGPTDITLDSDDVDENEPEGTLVGILQRVGGNPNIAFSLVSDAGGLFKIGAQIGSLGIAELLTNELLNFEDLDEHVILIKVTDGDGDYFIKTFTITVNDVNDAPVAAAVSIDATEDGEPVDGDFAGDDEDWDDDQTTLTYTIVDDLGPGEGSATNNDNGTFTFDPGGDFQDLAEGQTRDVTFTYKATDQHAADSNVAEVTITVTGVNDAPVATDEVAEAVEDGAPVVIETGTDDIDTDDDPTTLVYTILTQPAEGSVTSNDDGTFTFDPGGDFQDLAEGQTRDVSFTYKATDQHAADSNVAEVTITVTGVNDVPVATDEVAEAVEDGAPVVIETGTDDIDTDDAPTTLVYTILTQPAEGSVTSNDDGTFTFDPGGDFQDLAEGQTRDVSFTYKATDQHAADSNVAEVTITVTGANDAPVATDEVAEAVEDGDPVVIETGTDDIDTDDAPTTLVYTILTQPAEGSVTSNDDGTFTFDPGGDFQDLAEGQTRDVSFTYKATDQHAADSNVAEVTITVTGVNDVPVATDEVAEAVEDGAPVVIETGTDDIDTDDAPTTLVYTILTQPAEGSVTSNDDGTFTFDPGGDFQDLAEGQTRDVSFTYKATDQHAADSNVAEVTVTVTGANDAPVATDEVAEAVEDGDPVVIETGTDDIDTDDDPTTLVYTILTQPAEGSVTSNDDGTFTFDPGGDFQDLVEDETRDVSFTYKATDQHAADSNVAEVTITVTGVNDVPVATDEVAEAVEDGDPVVIETGTDDIDTDDDPTTLVYTILTQPAEGSVTSNDDGTFTFDPDGDFQDLAEGQTRDVSFTYKATDQHAADSNVAEVTITVTGVNDAPVATDEVAEAVEDGDPVVIETGTDDIDTDDAPTTLVYTILTQPAEGSVTSNDDGTFTFDPDGDFQDLAEGQTRDVSFTYKATDQHAADSNVAEVTITVTGVNDDPVAQDDDVSADEDTALFGNVLVNNGNGPDFDVDGDPLTVSAVNGVAGTVGKQVALASGALVIVSANGQFVYNPNGQFESLAEGAEDTDTFTYTISDGKGGTDSASVTVTITGVNDAPVLTPAAPDLGVTNLETPVVIQVSSLSNSGSGTTTITDIDDGDVVGGVAVTGSTGLGMGEYSIDGGVTYQSFPAGLSDNSALLLNVDAWIRYTPDGLNEETATLTYRAWDASSGNNGDSGVDASVNGGTTAFSTDSDTASLIVDGTPPEAVNVSLLNDTGFSSEDLITSDPTLDITGVEEGATVEYSTDDGETWSEEFDPDDGEITVQVRQVDAAGNEGAAVEFSFTLDTVAPIPQIIDPLDEALVRCFTVRLAEEQTNGTDAVRNVWEVRDGEGAVWGPITSEDPENQFEVFWNSHTVDDGPYTVWVEMFDAAGNSSTDTIQITVDNTAPVAPGVSLLNDTGFSAEDGITSDPTLDITGVEEGATVEYSTDDGETWSEEFDPDDGEITVQVRQVDAAGNEGPATEVSFTLDTVAPTPEIVDPLDGAFVRCNSVRLAEVQINGDDAVRNVWQVRDGEGNVVFDDESWDAANQFEVFFDSHGVDDGPVHGVGRDVRRGGQFVDGHDPDHRGQHTAGAAECAGPAGVQRHGHQRYRRHHGRQHADLCGHGLSGTGCPMVGVFSLHVHGRWRIGVRRGGTVR